MAALNVHKYGSLMWAMDHSVAARASVAANAVMLGLLIPLVAIAIG